MLLQMMFSLLVGHTCASASEALATPRCGDEGGCPLPPNLQQAGGYATYPYGTCIYKPRPITYGGTLPLTPTSNTSSVMQGWTSGEAAYAFKPSCIVCSNLDIEITNWCGPKRWSITQIRGNQGQNRVYLFRMGLDFGILNNPLPPWKPLPPTSLFPACNGFWTL